MPQKLKVGKEKILDKWFVLIQNAQGRGQEVIEKTTQLLKQAEAPGVKVDMARVFPEKVGALFLVGAFKSLNEQGRDYLMISNENIKGMKLLVRAQDYGNNLFVFWCLICEPSTLDQISEAFSGKQGGQWTPVIKDMFMEEELTAYTTCIHHCVLEAVEALMANLGQDFSRVERKSRGFLGIS